MKKRIFTIITAAMLAFTPVLSGPASVVMPVEAANKPFWVAAGTTTLGVGDSTSIAYCFSMDTPVDWSSTRFYSEYDDSIVGKSYQNGKIILTGLKPGTTDYVVTSNTGYTDTIRITVTEEAPSYTSVFPASHWECSASNYYWYEKGVRQGTRSDPSGVKLDGTVRGREIYDPDSNGWYWLDAAYAGAKAVNKEVAIPYVYSDQNSISDEEMKKRSELSDAGMQEFVYNEMKAGHAKWVRYDNNGKMLKGWVTISDALARTYPDQAGNVYYYDQQTGLMAKGWLTIDGKLCHFDEISGKLLN